MITVILSPGKVALQNKLLDCLEENVDEKYFLSQKMIDCFTDMTDRNGYIRGEIFKPHIDLENVKYAYAITTRAGGRPTDNFIAIPEATLKGYAKAYEGDGVYINRPHQKRGVVQKGMIPTLKTSGNDIGVVVKDTRNLKQKLCDALIENKVVKNGDVINHSYTNSKTRPNLVDFIESGDGIMPTLTTRPDIFGVVVSDDDELLAIRKLTPRECWRLMGMSDEDFDKAQAVPMSNAQLYKQAGNAIVVDVLEAIFKNLFNESKQL